MKLYWISIDKITSYVGAHNGNTVYRLGSIKNEHQSRHPEHIFSGFKIVVHIFMYSRSNSYSLFTDSLSIPYDE